MPRMTLSFWWALKSRAHYKWANIKKKKKKLHDVTSSTGLKKSCTVQIINAPNIDYK